MELGGNQDDGDLGGNGEGGGNDEIASPLTPHGPPRRLIVPDSSDEDDEPDSDDDATPTSTQVPATQVPATQTQSLRRLRRTRAQVKFKTSPAIQKQQLTDGEVLLRPSRRKMRRLRTAQARLGFAKHYLVQAKKLDASPEILDAIEAAGRAFIADAIPHITMTKRRIATRGPMGGKTSMDLLPFTRLYSNTELAHIVKHFSTSPSIFYCTDMDDAERIQVACPEYNGELCKQRGCYIVLAEWIKSADNRPTKSVVIRYPGIAIKQSIADRAKQHIAEMRRAERAFRSKDHAALEKYLGKHRGLYRPRLKRVVVLKLTGIGPDMPSTENECAEWMIERFPTPRCGRSFEGLADRCPGPHRDAFLVRVFIAWVEHFWASFYDSPRFRYDGVYWLDGYRFDHEEESGEKMIGGNSNAPKTSFLDIEGTEAKFYFSHQHQKLSTAQKDKIRQRAIREATLGATPATAADRAHDFDVATSAADNTGMVPPLLADTTAANEDVIEELTQKLAQSYFTSMADDLDDNDLVGTESDDEDYDPDDEPCFDDVDTQVPVRDGSGDVEGVDEGDEAEGAAARGMAFPEVPLNIYFKGRIHVVRFEDSPDPQVPFKPRLDEQTRHDAHSFTSLSDSTTTGSRTQRTLILPTTFPAERREAIWGRLSSGRTGLPCTIVGGGKRAHVDFGGATDKTPKFAFEVDLPSNLGFVDGPATFHMQPKPDGYECHPLAASPWASAVLSYFIVFFMQETMQGKLKWQYEPIAQIVDDPHWERGFIWLAEMASVKRLDFEIKYCQLPVEDARVANGIAVRLRQVCARFPLIDKGPLYRNWYISVPVPKPIMVELGTGRGRRAPESPVDSNAPEGEVYAELKISKKAGPHDLLLRVNQQPVGGYDHLYARVVKRDDTSPYPGDEGWEAVIPGGFLPKWSCHLFINLPRRAHGVAKDKLWLPGPSTS